MSADQFRHWRAWVGWTQRRAALELGVSRRALQKYEAGMLEVPRKVALACDSLTRLVRLQRRQAVAREVTGA